MVTPIIDEHHGESLNGGLFSFVIMFCSKGSADVEGNMRKGIDDMVSG